jgi:hypothetical protein
VKINRKTPKYDASPGDNFYLRKPDHLTQSSLGHLTRFLREERERRVLEEKELRQAIVSLEKEFQRRQGELIGENVASRLRTYRQLYQHPNPNSIADPRLITNEEARDERQRQRALSLRYALDLGVNLDGLRRLQLDGRSRFRSLTNVRRASNIEITYPDFGFNQLPSRPDRTHSGTSPNPKPPPAPPDKPWVIHNPLYNAGWWDRGGAGSGTGQAEILALSSHLNYDTSISGSTIWARNWNAGNIDLLWANADNGFLVWHTMEKTGLLEVEIDFQCAWCQHCIETYNEWGWSDGWVDTNEEAVMAVLWNWEDVVPASESFYGSLAKTSYSGNGDNSPYVQNPVNSGQMRKAKLFSQTSFPGGATLVIYVATRQGVGAWVNDVSVNTFVDSDWFVKEVRIRQA